MVKWWAYIHINGNILVKRFFSYEDMEEARDSQFVEDLAGPWECSKEEAEKKAKEVLG